MSPESIQLFFALAVGFAIADLLATGYQLATNRPLSFRSSAAALTEAFAH